MNEVLIIEKNLTGLKNPNLGQKVKNYCITLTTDRCSAWTKAHIINDIKIEELWTDDFEKAQDLFDMLGVKKTLVTQYTSAVEMAQAVVEEIPHIELMYDPTNLYILKPIYKDMELKDFIYVLWECEDKTQKELKEYVKEYKNTIEPTEATEEPTEETTEPTETKEEIYVDLKHELSKLLDIFTKEEIIEALKEF